MINSKFYSKNGRILVRFYEKLTQGLLQRIEDFDPDAETLDTLQAQVDDVLDQANAVSVDFSNVELPDQYAKGIEEANKILSAIGVKLATTDQLAHETVVRQMIQQMNINFGKNIDAVRNGIRGAISKATQQKIQDTFASSVTTKEATANTVHILRENGVQSIIDRGGKTWNLQTYTDMVSRTTARSAYNQGIVNRSLENNIVVFKVSYSGTSHKECQVWENALLSSNGEFGLPTIAEATARGLFHPNCFHILQPAPSAQLRLEEGDADARMFAN